MKGTAAKARAWRITEISAAESATLAAGFNGFRVEEVRQQGEKRRPALPEPVLIRLGRDGTGEIVCTALAMGLGGDGQPGRITATATRFPLQEIIAAIFRTLPAAGHTVVLPGEVPLRSGGVAFYGDVVASRVRPGAKGYTDDALRDFIREYAEVRKSNPRDATTTLARRKNLSPAAIRYVKRLAEKRHLAVRPGRKKGRRK